jgi:hypothetical protein
MEQITQDMVIEALLTAAAAITADAKRREEELRKETGWSWPKKEDPNEQAD